MALFKVLQDFYKSDEWIDFRHLIIMQRSISGSVVCALCGNVITKATEITLHHIKELTPDNVNDHTISLNPDNVLIVHNRCHNHHHNRFNIKTHQVYIVYGAPMSGKTSYIKERMQPGDLIVDMDLLYQAMSMNDLYNKPNCLLGNVKAVHNLIIDNIKTRYGKWNDAYIIGGYADKYKRDKLKEELGAELIFINTSKEECIARLEMDGDRRNMKSEYINYINNWFDTYRA